ncbi:GtrA family protein [Corynebacterium kozikiae]|uniref:GtrA family protein n=1 Tax=Corynebacterium kozikiae TaxID=2968469 RepID=UPI00359C6BCE
MVVASSSGKSIGTQGAKFIVSGGISAVVDLGLTYLMQVVFGFSAAGSRTVGFIFGTLTAYLINRRWTFQAEHSNKRLLQVSVLYSITYFVNVGGYNLLFDLFTHYNMVQQAAVVVAFVIAQGTATVINFFVQRLFIFRG